ncbi:hypothetical protein [Micromonospora parathelypteridis]|uniref:DUF5666 domain-containing protein n=1 Tax=Micromonospora parathelypteridis TaxID=1839617 RepID=A0A840VNL8_9ACTN|nr:hypothetical protein [Micromonospora parathelypteridis]MBB5475644.1 hypothetical protein [Micromonospora parathelypteridis]
MDSSDTVIFDRVDDHPQEPSSAGAPDRGLTGALAAAAPRRWWNRATPVLGVLVLVLAGFLGGVHVQQRWGEPSSTAGSGRAGFPGGFPTAFPGAAGRGQNGAGAPGGTTAPAATSGKVKLVDGGTLYLETADGTVVTVRTTDDTAVRVAEASKLTALKAGQSVTVQGGPAADGTVTATTVTAGG